MTRPSKHRSASIVQETICLLVCQDPKRRSAEDLGQKSREKKDRREEESIEPITHHRWVIGSMRRAQSEWHIPVILHMLIEVIYFDPGSESDPSILQGMSSHVVGPASFNSA
jgi:hypothetical protein